jgi:Peptidase A4 family
MLKISSHIRLLGLAVVAGAVLLGASPLPHAPALRTVAPHRHGPASNRHLKEDGTATSSNWGGYAIAAAPGNSATSVSVTSASGSWVVPTVTCSANSSTEYASFWVGIDGWDSSTVEQTGTDSDCSKGKPSYYAWYEFYPEGPYYAGELTDLHAGDVISATVTYNTSGALSGTFTVAITDEQQPSLGFTATLTPTHQTGTPSRSSAEWITERTGKLADFVTVNYGDQYTNVSGTRYATGTVNGTPYTNDAIGSFPAANVLSVTMEGRNGTPIAIPSALMSKTPGTPGSPLSSFFVDWKSAGN